MKSSGLDRVYYVQGLMPTFIVFKVKTVIFNQYLNCYPDPLLYYSFQEHLPDHKTLPVHSYYEWFEPAVDKWLDLAKFKVGITSTSMYCTDFKGLFLKGTKGHTKVSRYFCDQISISAA